MRIRSVGDEDLPFLTRMWHTAAFWQPEAALSVDEALEVPELARYIAGWGRDGDVGLVAEVDGQAAGAAWYRLFSAAAPGYGYVAEDTPELAIAVEPAFRRAGVGAALLDALIAHAVAAGVRALSLSVSAGNPSRRLYERAGFADVAVDEGGSHTMLLGLDRA